MKKIADKIKKIVFSSSYSAWVYAVLVIVIACVLAYFSRDISFYEIDNTAAAYTFETVSAENQPYTKLITFDYKDTTIQVAVDSSLTENPTIYGSTRYGVAAMTEENLAMVDETFLGSFAAVYPKQNWDVDGDGATEAVFYTVKTDLRSIQSNSSATPLFRDKNIPLEVGLDGARQLFVYFQTKVLAEREVTIHFNNGSSMKAMTDAFGYINGISVHQIRDGVTIEYAPNAITTYYCRYQPETTSVMSSAIYPFLVLAALVVVGVVLCSVIRKKNDNRTHRVYGAVKRQGSIHKPKFVIIRWIVMIVSFALLTWGGTWLGYWFEELYLPVFTCSKYNTDQIVSSSCYYFSHLNVLFTLPWQTIVTFFACFFIPIVLFGKLFCGFICPMGLVQDTLHVARQKTGITGFSLTDKLYERLSLIKWTAVMLFLGMGFAGLDFCNICPVITLSPAFSGFKTSIYVSGFIMLFVLIGSFFKKRFFCNICPLGLLMGLCHPISLVRLKKDCTACTECGACYNACPMGIKTVYTEREKVNVTTTNCIMCGECIRNCPEDNALKLTLAGLPIYTSSREEFMKRYDTSTKKSKRTEEEHHAEHHTD